MEPHARGLERLKPFGRITRAPAEVAETVVKPVTRTTFTGPPISIRAADLTGPRARTGRERCQTRTAIGYGTFADSMQYLRNFTTNTWPGGTGHAAMEIHAATGFSISSGNRSMADWETTPPLPASPFQIRQRSFIPAHPSSRPMRWISRPAVSVRRAMAARALPRCNGGSERSPRRVFPATSPGSPANMRWSNCGLPHHSQPLPHASHSRRSGPPGRTYRVRVRHKDTNGSWSHWSDRCSFRQANRV